MDLAQLQLLRVQFCMNSEEDIILDNILIFHLTEIDESLPIDLSIINLN